MTTACLLSENFSRLRHISICVICVALLSSGCGTEPAYREDPCDVVQAYLTAVELQDNQSVWAFLSDDTRKKLDDKAARFNASPEHGNSRSGAEMLRMGHVLSSTREYKKIVLASENSDSADVDIVMHDDRNLRIQLKKENGRWAVELPI